MPPIATLPMYDWPERYAETDALWATLRDALRAEGFDPPDDLTRDGDLEAALAIAGPADRRNMQPAIGDLSRRSRPLCRDAGAPRAGLRICDLSQRDRPKGLRSAHALRRARCLHRVSRSRMWRAGLPPTAPTRCRVMCRSFVTGSRWAWALLTRPECCGPVPTATRSEPLRQGRRTTPRSIVIHGRSRRNTNRRRRRSMWWAGRQAAPARRLITSLRNAGETLARIRRAVLSAMPAVVLKQPFEVSPLPDRRP